MGIMRPGNQLQVSGGLCHGRRGGKHLGETMEVYLYTPNEARETHTVRHKENAANFLLVRGVCVLVGSHIQVHVHICKGGGGQRSTPDAAPSSGVICLFFFSL